MTTDLEQLRETQEQLIQAQETLRAIRNGEVDALIVGSGTVDAEVYTLSTADRPYRMFLESMQEGAATLSDAGMILFANERLGALLGCRAAEIVARQMIDFVASSNRSELIECITTAGAGSMTLELQLLRPDGGLVSVLIGVSELDVDDERLTCLTFTDLTAEHALLEEVRASQQRFLALYRGAPVPAYTWQRRPEGLVLIDYNDAGGQFHGVAATNAVGHVVDDFYPPDSSFSIDLYRCFDDQVVIEREEILPNTATGTDHHLQSTMVPVPPDLVVLHQVDITERWLAEQALRASEERYRTIVENAHEGISMLDAEGVFAFANPRAAELLGYDLDDLIGMQASTLLSSSATLAHGSLGVPGAARYEITAPRPDGTSIDLLVSTAPVVAPGGTGAGSLIMMSDVSGLRVAEEKLAHWALHDPLTELPNRTLLMDRINHALARAPRQHRRIAVLFFDVDGFKDVNDTFGHHVGDEVLRVVGKRLSKVVRPADTVARIGGDEFVVLCEDMLEAGAFGLAARALAILSEPMEASGHPVMLTTSIGVAFARSADAAELVRDADAAMYLAKERGKNRVEIFDENLRQGAANRISLITDLRHALTHNELRVHYQPVFSLVDEALVGVEALVRWEHPRRGLLLPGEFIPAAESSNLIGAIGAWVLQESCRQAARWSAVHPDVRPLSMAVNVSARQLAPGSGFVRLVSDALNETKINPRSLVLEVTESVVMDDPEVTLAILTELKSLGVRLAIDDFGTGYSSLVYLKRFPVNQLKVDRTFVAGLGTDPDDSAIVASVIGLAHAVGIVAIAEGVETVEQLRALQQLGCGYGQGHLWSPAVSALELDVIIQAAQSRARGWAVA